MHTSSSSRTISSQSTVDYNNVFVPQKGHAKQSTMTQAVCTLKHFLSVPYSKGDTMQLRLEHMHKNVYLKKKKRKEIPYSIH